MRIAMLAPIAWRTPPRHYGPWERVVSLVTEELVELGADVTLFATADSITQATLRSVCSIGYEEDSEMDATVWRCMHISEVFECADDFDIIHNNFDFVPLSYCGLVDTPVVTTIHGFSSPKILPVYKKYNDKTFYVSISDADRSPELDYVATVYHGIDLERFTFQPDERETLVFFGRIHHDKGAKEAIEIAKITGRKLILAGIIQDMDYYEAYVKPFLDDEQFIYIGSVGPKDRDEVLGNCAALLHPINFNEPFGLSVVEAMACGTPVIAFNRGSMSEIIQDGENGFLVSNIEEAVKAVERLPAINRAACRKIVEERFTAKRMAKDYLGVYEKVLERTNKK